MAEYRGAAADAAKALQLVRKRQKELEELDLKKQKLQEDLAIGSIHDKFATHIDAVGERLNSDTVGLVTLEEMKEKQQSIIEERQKQLSVAAKSRLDTKSGGKSKKKTKQKANLLSFELDAEEEEGVTPEDEPHATDTSAKDGEEKKENTANSDKERKRFGKNPEVDTSFLPDRERDEEEMRLRDELRKEWMSEQVRLKEEPLSVIYNYWDGSGHRRHCFIKKGNTIEQFLNKALDALREDFAELKSATIDQLMFIKEDTILPHYYTFYDFIVAKARGKSGPLFDFSAQGDVKIVQDASKAKDESHASKICTRQWYQMNKHIFPANRWEAFVADKVFTKAPPKD